MAEEIEDKRISPWALAGLGAAAGIATATALYMIFKAREAPPTPPPGAATLYGIVTDAETGEPIPDVLVTLNGASTYTDGAGAYAFTDIAPGEYVLEFSKEGYETLVY